MSITPDTLRLQSHLQNIIDQAPHAHTATQARELMRRLKPVPEDSGWTNRKAQGRAVRNYADISSRRAPGSQPGGKASASRSIRGIRFIFKVTT